MKLYSFSYFLLFKLIIHRSNHITKRWIQYTNHTFEKWSLLLIAILIIINLIQWNYSSDLKYELDSCNSELDSLKIELYSKKNIKTENKEKLSNKTLDTKKEFD